MSEYLKQAQAYFPDGMYQKLLSIKTSNVDTKKTEAKKTEVKEIHDIFDQLSLFMEEKGRAITSSQLRNIFAAIKETGSNLEELAFLRPKIAYISARQQNRNARIITEFINDLLKQVQTDEGKFKSFKTLMEAMVAYHKLYHPK